MNPNPFSALYFPSKEDEKIGGDINKEIIGSAEFRNVSVKYDEKHALKDISFKIEPKTGGVLNVRTGVTNRNLGRTCGN